MAVGGVLFDIDGVLTTSWKAIPGAAETLRILGDHRIACSYLTNTTTRTRQQIPERIAEEDMPGIDIAYSSDFSGPEAPQTPDVVLLGGAGPEYSHVTLSWVYDWMTQGVPVVAMHRSTAWTTTDGVRIDTGMYLIGLEEVSGRKATAVGKPAPAGFLAAASRLAADPEQMYMVGDDLNNDVLAAQVVGMTGVLVRTGKFRQDTLDRWAADEFAMQPNYVIDSVADLPALLGL